MNEWQPMTSEPNDGKFRFYGLFVEHNKTGFEWFEAHYVAQNDDGQLILPSGDNFDDWAFDDFTVWADAPTPPPHPAA